MIFEQDDLLTGGGLPYTVFTPFKKAWLARLPDSARTPRGGPALREFSVLSSQFSVGTARELGFEVRQQVPVGGEREAVRLLAQFKDGGAMKAYSTQRDILAVEGTSRLSPHLRFGTISPRQCLAAALSTLNHEFPSRRSFSPAASDAKKDGRRCLDQRIDLARVLYAGAVSLPACRHEQLQAAVRRAGMGQRRRGP